MIEKFRQEGCISELNFGYNTKIRANSTSDIPALVEIQNAIMEVRR